MLSKYFSYYNYKITQNIDNTFFKKKCAGTIRPAHLSNMQFCFFYLTMVFTTLSPTRTITNPWQSTAFSP